MNDITIAKVRWYFEQEMSLVEQLEKQTTDEYRLAVLRGRREGIKKCIIHFNNTLVNG